MPSYTLTAERYIYLPLAMLVFGLAYLFQDKEVILKRNKIIVSSILLTLLTISFSKAYLRTLDWKDNFSFINSTYKSTNDPFFKAIRLGMLGKTVLFFNPPKKDEANKYFYDTLKLLDEARKETLENKKKYQASLPNIIKSYGLDYDTKLIKIAFLETASRVLELNQDYKIGLNILEPYINDPYKIDPEILELFCHLLIKDSKIKEANKILLTARKNNPIDPTLLSNLIDISLLQNDRESGEKYLSELLKYYKHDISTLSKAISFYQNSNNLNKLAYYSYLYALKTQSKTAYQQALSVYLSLNKVDKAKFIVHKLEKLDPNDPLTLQLASKYYYLIKDYKMSLNTLSKAYSIVSSGNYDETLSFEITINLIKLYLLFEDEDKAIELSKKAISFANNNVGALFELISFYNSLGLEEYSKYCTQRIEVLKKKTNV